MLLLWITITMIFFLAIVLGTLVLNIYAINDLIASSDYAGNDALASARQYLVYASITAGVTLFLALILILSLVLAGPSNAKYMGTGLFFLLGTVAFLAIVSDALITLFSFMAWTNMQTVSEPDDNLGSASSHTLYATLLSLAGIVISISVLIMYLYIRHRNTTKVVTKTTKETSKEETHEHTNTENQEHSHDVHDVHGESEEVHSGNEDHDVHDTHGESETKSTESEMVAEDSPVAPTTEHVEDSLPSEAVETYDHSGGVKES